MPNYTIRARFYKIAEIDIEAPDEDEARSIADDVDFNEWSIMDGDMEILSVVEEEVETEG